MSSGDRHRSPIRQTAAPSRGRRPAASRPLFDGPGAARSSASSAELVVSTPNAIGTPVLAAAAVMPCAHADAMYSKCGVAPRIRQPRQTTACDLAGLGDALRRHRNLERARHAQHLDVARRRCRRRAAPPARRSSRRSVTKSLKRATTMATRITCLARRPCASRETPWCLPSCRRTRRSRRTARSRGTGRPRAAPSSPWCTASRM